MLKAVYVVGIIGAVLTVGLVLSLVFDSPSNEVVYNAIMAGKDPYAIPSVLYVAFCAGPVLSLLSWATVGVRFLMSPRKR